MNEQTQKDPQFEDQPPEVVQPATGEVLPLETEPTSSEEPSTAQPPRKFKLNIWQFAAGFLGWFLVSLLIYAQKMDAESLMICGGVFFLLNVGVLILLLIKLRSVGLGMLSALGVNLVISLILGLDQNAFCFIPFYKK